MKGISDYAVVYDISSDKERNKVDRVLKGYGFRIQKSVYECRLTKKSLEELIQKLKELNINTGFIKIYRLEWSFKKVSIGVVSKKEIDEGSAFII